MKICFFALGLCLALGTGAMANEEAADPPELSPPVEIQGPPPPPSPPTNPLPPSSPPTPATPPQAQPPQAGTGLSEEPRLPEDRVLELGVGFFNFDYKEELDGKLRSAETGAIPSVHFVAHRRFSNGFFRGALYFGTENTRYDGTDQSGNPLLSTTGNIFLDTELDFGVILWEPNPVSYLSFYAGFGARLWRRKLSSYTEEYSWLNCPVGMMYQWDFDPRWRIGIDLAVKVLFNGQITADFSELDPSFKDAQGLLGTSRLGARLQVPITYAMEENTSLVIAPWYEYVALSSGPDFPVQNTGGQLVALAHEPASHASIFGLWVGVGLKF